MVLEVILIHRVLEPCSYPRFASFASLLIVRSMPPSSVTEGFLPVNLLDSRLAVSILNDHCAHQFSFRNLYAEAVSR